MKHQILQVLLRASKVEPLGPGKICISYLPLAHIFEQVVQMCILFRGGAIGFYRGNTLKLLDDVKVRKDLFLCWCFIANL
jgi:long-chain acyl-CoA synthetase